MTPRNPVEFIRQLVGGQTQRAGNRIQIEDANAALITALNPFPVNVVAGGGPLKVEGIAGGVPQPVSGTFWQATQPVSGTFWQATQPVSGAFYQTTQPVKGTGFSIPVTLTVTNGAYTIGDVVGGLITLANMVSANGKHALIHSVSLGGVSAIAYELWFISANIATPAADLAAFTLVAADEALVRGIVPISTADYFAAASAFNVASVRCVGLEVQAGAGTTTLYAYLKATAVTSPDTTTLYLRVSGEMVD